MGLEQLEELLEELQDEKQRMELYAEYMDDLANEYGSKVRDNINFRRQSRQDANIYEELLDQIREVEWEIKEIDPSYFTLNFG